MPSFVSLIERPCDRLEPLPSSRHKKAPDDAGTLSCLRDLRSVLRDDRAAEVTARQAVVTHNDIDQDQDELPPSTYVLSEVGNRQINE